MFTGTCEKVYKPMYMYLVMVKGKYFISYFILFMNYDRI